MELSVYLLTLWLPSRLFWEGSHSASDRYATTYRCDAHYLLSDNHATTRRQSPLQMSNRAAPVNMQEVLHTLSGCWVPPQAEPVLRATAEMPR